MISLTNICLTLLAFYRLQMSVDTDKPETPLLKMYPGNDMRHPINCSEPDMTYYKNIFLKASILALLKNPNISIHSKIDTIKEYETKYDNHSKITYNLRAGGLFDDWAGF